MLEYIIVQAGGKGSRLGYLTRNKPKALVPINNLPMLFYLFQKYPDKKFIIIADYKKNVLRKYLEVFAKVNYQVIDACGTGTCAGIRQAIKLIPDEQATLLIWSDLILPEKMRLPDEYLCDDIIPKSNYIGISKTFQCRWRYHDGEFQEKQSIEHGVAGFFLFHNIKMLESVPESGEFVRWMQKNKVNFSEVSLAGTKEYGILEEYENLEVVKCRPFNRITIKGDILIKEAINDQGKMLAKGESAWYIRAEKMRIEMIPKIYSTSPLQMELIHGKNIYEYQLSHDKKAKILCKIVTSLKELHKKELIPTDESSIYEAYYNKTMMRLKKIEKLVPFAQNQYVKINGRNCKNIFFYKKDFENKILKLNCDSFGFIHGDCTFSNLILRENGDPVLIDPRGYFGNTDFFGDERYDWAKLYYSIVGNYDQFNLKKFQLDIEESEVKIYIASSGWEDMEREFFEMIECDPMDIKFLHAIIWLSLTTYAWQDYDSICGAFYNGLYYLDEVL